MRSARETRVREACGTTTSYLGWQPGGQAGSAEKSSEREARCGVVAGLQPPPQSGAHDLAV